MFQNTYSALLSGISGIPLEIECFIGGGLPYFSIVGIPAGQAASARERIRSALKSCGYPLPPSRVTINIRPVDPSQPLLAAAYEPLDLPIALTILACQRHIPAAALSSSLFVGELGLSGALRPINGALSLGYAAKRIAANELYLPQANAAEATFSAPCAVYPLHSLDQAIQVLCRRQSLPAMPPAEPAKPLPPPSFLNAIRGQDIGKRSLMIAAAGWHNVLFIGPPGCGKTLLANSLPALLPPLSLEQQIQITEIYSACGLLPAGQSLITARPFRSPHHSISATALIGGGASPRPGEITLAHQGVLFLDELAEFSHAALESLRQPLEEHAIVLNRLKSSLRLPANFLLVASMNPCPCGYYPDAARCHCTSTRLRQYYEKINTPLLDRIDLVVHLAPVKQQDLENSAPAISSAQAVCAVRRAHQAQLTRFRRRAALGAQYNAHMNTEQIQQFCILNESLRSFMHQAYDHYQLSMRSYYKVLKISRTIADLEGSDAIQLPHLTEALQYRLTLPGLSATL